MLKGIIDTLRYDAQYDTVLTRLSEHFNMMFRGI